MTSIDNQCIELQSSIDELNIKYNILDERALKLKHWYISYISTELLSTSNYKKSIILSRDNIVKIFDYLPVFDLAAISSTCSTFSNIIRSSPYIWKLKLYKYLLKNKLNVNSITSPTLPTDRDDTFTTNPPSPRFRMLSTFNKDPPSPRSRGLSTFIAEGYYSTNNNLIPSTASLLPSTDLLSDLSLLLPYNIPYLKLDPDFAIQKSDVFCGTHNHFKLSIEVKDDHTYIVLVESWEATLEGCAAEKAKKKSAVDESKRSIAVEICCRTVKKLLKELKFCLASLQLFHQLNTLFHDKEVLFKQIDSVSVKVTNKSIENLQNQLNALLNDIKLVQNQSSSDKSTLIFLKEQLSEVEEQYQNTQMELDTLREKFQTSISRKEIILNELEHATDNVARNELNELRTHKTILTKEIKTLRGESDIVCNEIEMLNAEINLLKAK